MRRKWTGVFVVLACALLAVPVASARPRSTVEQTIVDRDADNRLEPSDGQPLLLRTDLAPAPAAGKPASLAFFGQFTDKHVVDEESPLRVEFTDRYGLIFTSAYRPQEGLSAQVVEEMVEQIRNSTSPVTGRPLEYLMTTGDNTDNTQCNETRWMIDLLDGDKTVDPNSGVEGGTTFSDAEVCVTAGASPPAVQTTAAACDVPMDRLYDGVRGGGEYYEADSSAGVETGNDTEDGPGYSPDQAENQREAGRSSSVRDYPGLFEGMNKPFDATGVDVPWYGIFGNHDGLIQGNAPRNPAYEALAVSCTKVTGLPAEDERAITESSDRATAMAMVLSGILERAQEGDATVVHDIAADPRRRPLRKNEYIAEHLRGGGHSHGFTADNVASGMGNYSFAPRKGLRHIVLDTVAEAGLEEGNLDDAQFRWLHDELLKADLANEIVVVFGHHSLRTMGQPPVSPFLPGDTGGNLLPDVHFGEGVRNTGQQLPCLLTDKALPPYPTETVRCLLLRHDNVIAFVNGHEHANRITPYKGAAGQPGFWEINTASHIDWPQQSRVIEILDNPDVLGKPRTLTIATAVLDHAAAPNPGEGEASSASVQRLASISRELAFNDRHASNGEDGSSDAAGAPTDRNALLVVKDPRR